MVTLTPDQLKDLKREFIEFKLNEMSYEDMTSYIRDIWMMDGSLNDPYELEFEINSYDENLYEILTDYVTDTVGSYTALQEFCLLYTSPSPRDGTKSSMPSSA